MADNDDAATVTSTTSNIQTSSSNHKKSENHQMMKLKEANAKYKNLLKMAKERIQTQGDELDDLQDEMEKLKSETANNERQGTNSSSSSLNALGGNGTDSAYFSYKYDVPVTANIDDSGNCSIVRVCQRFKIESDEKQSTAEGEIGDAETEEQSTSTCIWALIEYEATMPDDTTLFSSPSQRFLRWRRFNSPLDLSDHIRRTSGEPIQLPSYSLTPTQSQTLQSQAQTSVNTLTEEFRRFRVKSEVSRRQADATIRSLQNDNVERTQRRMEGEDIEEELARARVDHGDLVRLKAEGVEVEARWKEAYDSLVAENARLRGTGSEALLAAQWRMRYETTLAEKEELNTLLEMERERGESAKRERRKEDAGKYEARYKDLKESFRMYRKKAKEIFEAQQRGDVDMLDLGDTGGAEHAKISYLRNLMVNYLSSEPDVREHMEQAIGTVLNFSDEDSEKVKEKKVALESWFN